MVKATVRHLTEADTEWLNEPVSYNPHSVRNLMVARGLMRIEPDGRTVRVEPEEEED